MLFRLGDESPEIFERAELRDEWTCGRPPPIQWPKDCQRRRLRGPRELFFPLRNVAPDRMDGRKIDDIEAHRRDVRKPCFAIAKGPVTPRLRRTGSRKYFVPGREARLFAVDGHGQLLSRSGWQVAIGIALNDMRATPLPEQWLRLMVYPWPRAAAAPSRGAARRHRPWARAAASSISSAPMSSSTWTSCPAATRFIEITAPGLETIDPAFHGVLVPAEFRNVKFTAPAIVAERLHRRRFAILVLSCQYRIWQATWS